MTSLYWPNRPLLPVLFDLDSGPNESEKTQSSHWWRTQIHLELNKADKILSNSKQPAQKNTFVSNFSGDFCLWNSLFDFLNQRIFESAFWPENMKFLCHKQNSFIVKYILNLLMLNMNLDRQNETIRSIIRFPPHDLLSYYDSFWYQISNHIQSFFMIPTQITWYNATTTKECQTENSWWNFI